MQGTVLKMHKGRLIDMAIDAMYNQVKKKKKKTPIVVAAGTVIHLQVSGLPHPPLPLPQTLATPFPRAHYGNAINTFNIFV